MNVGHPERLGCAVAKGGRHPEAASAIVFLACTEASYITGTTLGVDGGFGLR